MLSGTPGVLLETCFQAGNGERQKGHKHWARVSGDHTGRELGRTFEGSPASIPVSHVTFGWSLCISACSL